MLSIFDLPDSVFLSIYRADDLSILSNVRSGFDSVSEHFYALLCTSLWWKVYAGQVKGANLTRVSVDGYFDSMYDLCTLGVFWPRPNGN